MKKSLILLFPILLLSVIVSAQTQQGYVKTKGRLTKDGTLIPGQRIPSASVILKGGNSTVSGDDGKFSLLLPSSKFFLQNVQKKGYVLTDPEVLSKEYNYSKNDLILVMETPGDQWDDKRAAEKAMREQLQKQVDTQRQELERLKEEQRVTDEEYRERLQRIFELYDENDKLVNEMAEEYAKIDYDQLDEYNRQIRQYILNGELQEAKSLINSKGNIDKRIDDLHKHQEANAKEAETLAKRQEQLEASQAGTQKELEDIAQDCYNHFEICKLQHLNDSAAYWIELRAGLDTTNVDWQFEAANYHTDYYSFTSAIKYNQSIINLSSKNLNENPAPKIKALSNIGHIFMEKAEYDSAFFYLNKSKELTLKYLGEETEEYAIVLNNLGRAYHEIGNLEKGLYYYEQSLDIRKRTNSELFTSYINLSSLFHFIGDNRKSMEYCFQAFDYLKLEEPNNKHWEAIVCNSIAMDYEDLKIHDSALYYLNKAEILFSELYGGFNPNLAIVYSNMGDVYTTCSQYDTALVILKKALVIDSTVFGNHSPYIATIHNNMGQACHFKGDFDGALYHYFQALSIDSIIYGNDNINMVAHYLNLANFYQKTNQHNESIKYNHIALEILEQNSMGQENLISRCYSSLASNYAETKEYDKAIANCNKSIEILTNLYGEDSPNLMFDYNTLAMIYGYQEDYDRALQIYESNIIPFLIATYGEHHSNTAVIYFNVGSMFQKKGDYKKAYSYCKNALDIFSEIVSDTHPALKKMEERVKELEQLINKK